MDAHASIINDVYWGGSTVHTTPTRYRDVIQPAGSHDFNVDGMQVTKSEGRMSVRLYGSDFSSSSPVPIPPTVILLGPELAGMVVFQKKFMLSGN